MEIIAHRKNLIEELKAVPTEYGIEVDIRSDGGQLIIHHDPFQEGEKFEEWITHYKHGCLILNVKEEGLESYLLDCMARHNIENFFFLDQSFPFLVKWSKKGERRCAVRVSEFESIATALTLAGKVNWVWVDCFTRFPLNRDQARQLADAGFKLCLVSPELQGFDADTSIPELQATLRNENIIADAVCTKRPELWKTFEQT